jgi:hypothetical protein
MHVATTDSGSVQACRASGANRFYVERDTMRAASSPPCGVVVPIPTF